MGAGLQSPRAQADGPMASPLRLRPPARRHFNDDDRPSGMPVLFRVPARRDDVHHDVWRPWIQDQRSAVPATQDKRPQVHRTASHEGDDAEMNTDDAWLTYIDHLQRKNADDLAFYPLSTLEKARESGHVIEYEENGQPGGYLWFGALRSGYDVTIYQACIDYDLRRQYHGFAMLADLVSLARAANCTGVRLKCASSAAANQFWQAAGFYCTRVSQGGVKRAREINHYRTDIQAPLLTVSAVEPSSKAIDLTAYNVAKREGQAMPSRFSRSHYGALASDV